MPIGCIQLAGPAFMDRRRLVTATQASSDVRRPVGRPDARTMIEVQVFHATVSEFSSFHEHRPSFAQPGDCQMHWQALKADFARYRAFGYSTWSGVGFWAVAIYRLQGMLRDGRPKWPLLPLRAVLAIFRRMFSLVTGIQISADARIGPGLLVPHPGAIWVDRDTTIGAGCTIYHGCTIGAGPNGSGATIGNDVFLSCQSSIIGRVVIGDGALIAANTLVISDVPAGATAIGVPARMLPGKAAPR